MATAPAQIPTSFGHELRACLRCRLVKTYDQVLVPYYPLFFIIVFCLQFLFLFHSSESQAVRTAHSLRWKKITSVLLIALLPILMGLFISILFLQNPLHLWISRYSFCFSSSIWFATGSFQLWIQIGVGLPVGCALVGSIISCYTHYIFPLLDF